MSRKTARTIGVYKSYNFVDKDPVIDIVRRIVELYAIEHDIKFSTAMARLSERSGVTVTCMRGWFFKGTRRPQFATIQAVARAAGNSFQPRMRVVASRKAA